MTKLSKYNEACIERCKSCGEPIGIKGGVLTPKGEWKDADKGWDLLGRIKRGEVNVKLRQCGKSARERYITGKGSDLCDECFEKKVKEK